MDIVEKLKMLAVDYNLQMLDEAADEIARLRRRLQDGSPIHEATIQHMAMEIASLKKERDAFYMDYRMKCDAETKALIKQCDELEGLLRDSQCEHKRCMEALDMVMRDPRNAPIGEAARADALREAAEKVDQEERYTFGHMMAETLRKMADEMEKGK